MISRTAEYAVRAALWLVRHHERPGTVRQVAADTGVPGGYLAKILRALGRAGLVRAQPGPGGGFLLNRPPEAVSVLDVIDATDPIHRVGSCPLGLPEHAHSLCPFHARLDSAVADARRAFANCTLAELVAESDASGLFCSRNHGGGLVPSTPLPLASPLEGKERHHETLEDRDRRPADRHAGTDRL